MNQLYSGARQRFLTKYIDWNAENEIAFTLLNDAYVFDESHIAYAVIPPEAIAARSVALDRYSTEGWAQTPVVVFSGVQSDKPITSIVISRAMNVGDPESNHELLVFYDQVHQLPYTPPPVGGDFWLVYDQLFDPGGWFRL